MLFNVLGTAHASKVIATCGGCWSVQLLARRTTKVAAVALANKTARIIWAIMSNGERYREPVGQAA
jgi:hypothetical protein